MTLPEKPPSRKLSRLGLYAPFLALLAAVAAWAIGWSLMRAAVFRHMDAAASDLARTGYRVDWTSRSISGFPFRLDLDIAGPRLRETSGWGLSAPRLKAEAYVFAADHWVIVAPDGVVLTRRVGGPVTVGATALRASLSDAGAHPPRLSVEGLGLTFAPAPGAAPFAFSDAAELHLHAKAGPDDQGAFYLELDRARPAHPGVLADVAAGAPVTLIADAIYSHAAALAGEGFTGALRDWTAAGGGLTLRRLSVEAGAVAADSRAGALTIGPDGRLRGSLKVELRRGPRLLEAMTRRGIVGAGPSSLAEAIMDAHARGETSAVTLDFQAGRTTLGPVSLGPAPRVY
jgi:hypothetical protein